MTKRLYIVGHPVAHSKSPAMYNAVYEKLGLDWEYGFKDINSAEGAEAFLKGDDYVSVNITTPYKPEAFHAATILGATAKLAGGVNLLVRKDANLLGYNVDGDGAIRFLEREGVNLWDAKVVVCGTGPTALSILHAATIAGAKEVLLLGRNKEKSKQVLQRYVDKFRELTSTAIPVTANIPNRREFMDAYELADFKFGSYETSKQAITDADVIVDATILGMKEGDPSPFDTSLLHEGQVVMDTVYGHGESAILHDARAAGCEAFNGAGMLVSQAVLSANIVFEIQDVHISQNYDELFDIMAKGAGFDFL